MIVIHNLSLFQFVYNHRWAVPRYFFGTGTVGTFVVPVPVPSVLLIWKYRYRVTNFSKVPSTGTAVLLQSTVLTYVYNNNKYITRGAKTWGAIYPPIIWLYPP